MNKWEKIAKILEMIATDEYYLDEVCELLDIKESNE